MANYSRDPSKKRYGAGGFDQGFNKPVTPPPTSRTITNPRDPSLLAAGVVPPLEAPSGSAIPPPNLITPNLGLPEGFQQHGSTFTNRGWQGGTPGRLKDMTEAQAVPLNLGPKALGGQYAEAGTRDTGTGSRYVGGPHVFGRQPDPDANLVDSINQVAQPRIANASNRFLKSQSGPSPFGNPLEFLRGKSPLQHDPAAAVTGSEVVGGSNMGGINYRTPTSGDSYVTSVGPQPQGNIPGMPARPNWMSREVEKQVANISPYKVDPESLFGEEFGPPVPEGFEPTMTSPLPAVNEAGEAAARKAFPLTGLPTEVAGNYMDYLNNALAMAENPEYRGELRGSNVINNAMQLMAQNPNFGVSTVEKIPQGMKTLDMGGGHVFKASRVGTRTTASPMDQMAAIAGIQLKAHGQGDAATQAAASELFGLLNAEAGGAKSTLNQTIAAGSKPKAESTQSKAQWGILNKFAADDMMESLPSQVTELMKINNPQAYEQYQYIQRVKAEQAARAKSAGSRTSDAK